MILTACYRFMVIPDMLKNAPMFKRLDARIKVWFHDYLPSLLITKLFYLISQSLFSSVKGKGASIGVGRGRAVGMRARVSP